MIGEKDDAVGDYAGGCEGDENRVETDADSYLSTVVALCARQDGAQSFGNPCVVPPMVIGCLR